MALVIQHEHPAAPHLRGGPREFDCHECGAHFEVPLEDESDEADRFVEAHLHRDR